MKMKFELLCKVKNYIRYKTPWRYVTYNSFNPRTHVGCDIVAGLQQTRLEFQSTHPRRVRHRQHTWIIEFYEFQSTHPRRVRLHIQQKAEYQCAKIIILRKTAKKIRIKYHKRYIICKSLIFRRCETIDYFAILQVRTFIY